MRKVWVVTVAVAATVTSGATACDQPRIVDDAKWCFGNISNGGFGDLLLGSCKKDAAQNLRGFYNCQGHNISSIGNFGSCTAGQQLDAVRSAAMAVAVYSDPHACGF